MIEARVQAVSSDRGEDSPSVELSCGSAERPKEGLPYQNLCHFLFGRIEVLFLPL